MFTRAPHLVFLFALATLCVYSLFSPLQVKATANQVIFSTVRIPICGDLVTEYPEECENTDLQNATCRSLGFDAGTVSCDIACDFDTSSCYGVAPTPLPTSTPSPTTPAFSTTPGQSSNATEDSVSIQASTQSAFLPTQILEFKPEIVLKNLAPHPLLPEKILALDPNKNGILDSGEVAMISTNWVQAWQHNLYLYKTKQVDAPKQCDFNGDGWCNIYDFSILLSYVNGT